MPEQRPKVGGGTTEGTNAACLVNTARGDHAEQPANGRHLPQEMPDTVTVHEPALKNRLGRDFRQVATHRGPSLLLCLPALNGGHAGWSGSP